MFPPSPRSNSLRLDLSDSNSRRAMTSFISLSTVILVVVSIFSWRSHLQHTDFIARERMALVVGNFHRESERADEGLTETLAETDGHHVERSTPTLEDFNELYEHVLAKQTENELLRKMLDKKQGMIDFLEKKSKANKKADQSSSETILMSALAKSSHDVKGEIIDLIVKEYTSPDSPDDEGTTLDSALEAIDLKHTDGEAIQVKGFPFLYVGSVGASLNKESLLNKNITHVVNWSNSARCNVVDGIEYLCVRGIRDRTDMSRPESVEELRDAVEFVERTRLAGGKVMSHCWYGKNRSVTLLVAYLMKYSGMEIGEATDLVAETRPIADPYVKSLELYRDRYLINDDSNA
ncbi:hypothetical protein HJC23_000615 [Cyclotella cryptica]|uniref:protein-tyrosine-phosphatase n=1 Tax=Cyclotella cryptica TaxID=29204 RepID=A0ABD3Q7P5_9STRA|eukprot:CCRYP_008006-RA/>CCRYP_008006-RA protein AED:0.03 eAED:0.03 QI:223/1/1/1/1/1/2/309/349